MTTYSISQLAKAFNLSRSTLLYYDRIGLLQASSRSPAGYRLYLKSDYDKLERICTLRNAGLPLAEIMEMLAREEKDPGVSILEKRLKELNTDIINLRKQQHLVTAMLSNVTDKDFKPAIDKNAWVEMLQAAGMDEAAMKTWHVEFEKRSPEGHMEFLLSLGVPQDEAQRIQDWAREGG